MDPGSIPENVKQIINDRNLSMSQKLVAFMAFMPNLPENNADIYQDNLDLGKEIKQLINDKKISLGKFDENFKLYVEISKK